MEIKMKNFTTPNELILESDSKSINAAIERAVANGSRCVRIPKNNERTGEALWEIDETIDLPSDIEIVIDDAHLVLAEGKFLNMFRAVAEHDETGASPDSVIKNIAIRGNGAAVLDGGKYNGLGEKTAQAMGLDIYLNTTLLFFNVDGLVVENLSVINQRWWGITNVFVKNARYSNVHFIADFSRVDENGVLHPDEYPTKYSEIQVKNADGIDLRIGCNNFVIENITGFTEDDSIALTALGRGEIKRGLFVRDAETAIHDVKIRNVVTDSYCANVRLLNGNGHKLYNVEIDGVASLLSNKRTGDHSCSMRNNSTIRIGDMAYTSEHPNVDDTKNIKIRNVSSEAACGVTLCNGISDLVIENVTAHGGYAAVGTFRKYKDSVEDMKGEFEHYTATLKNPKISNIHTTSDKIIPVMNEYLNIVE